MFEKSLMMASSNGNKTSLYETLRHTGAATLLESLQSQLKMKEGEITQLQVSGTTHKQIKLVHQYLSSFV